MDRKGRVFARISYPHWPCMRKVTQKPRAEGIQKDVIEVLAGKKFAILIAGDDEGGTFYLNWKRKDLFLAVCRAITDDGKIGFLFRARCPGPHLLQPIWR